MSEAFSSAGRQKATDVLRDRARSLEYRALGLRQLADKLDEIQRTALNYTPNGEDIPLVLPYVAVGSEAEIALWQMACDVK